MHMLKNLGVHVAGFLLLSLVFMPIFSTAWAVVPPPDTTPKTLTFGNPLKVGSVEELIFLLVDIALQLGVVVAALALIWVGFSYVAARGNPAKVSAAHKALFYTILGIAVLFGSKVIVEIIRGTIEPLAPNLFKQINN
jgi:hypothetical protein